MAEADTGKYQRQINRNNSSVSAKKAPVLQDEGRVRHYNQMWSMILGIILIACAILSITIGFIAVICESQFHELGPGIWAGMFFFAPGIFGIVARNKMRFLVFGFLGTSVGSLVISSNVIVILSIGLSIDHVENDNMTAIVVNITGIIVALIAMMTSLFAVILCSIPFCQPANNRCVHCSSKLGHDNLAFVFNEHQRNKPPEQEII